MKYLKFSFLICLFGLSLTSCKDDPEPFFTIIAEGVTFSNGDATVNLGQNAEVDFDIDNNLNADGLVNIVDGVSIANDLNLNDDGKVIIAPTSPDDTIFVFGNININDSLIISNGTLCLNRNLNINQGGILNVSNGANVHVQGDINTSGQIHGNRNITLNGIFNQNNGSITEEEPLF